MTINSRFVQIVLDVKDGDFDRFFLARLDACIRRQQGDDFTPTPQQEQQRDQLLAAARAGYARVSAAPPPLSVSDDYSKLPDGTQDLIRKKSRILRRMLDTSFPLAERESLVSSEVKILMAPWERFDAGVVAYLQETNLGTVIFVLPHLQLNIRDASLNTLRGTYVLTTRVNPQATLSYVQTHRALDTDRALVTGAVAGVDPGQALLSFATVAAFALPAPVGVLISGALSVVQMFFGGNTGQADAFSDAMKTLSNNIQAYLVIDEIKDSATTIKGALDWLATNTEVIKDLGTDKAAHDYIVGNPQTQVPGALADISSVSGPNSPLRDALETLYAVQQAASNQDWNLRMSAFDVLVPGVGTYLTFLCKRVQMQAALESEKGYQGPRLMYAYYDTFRSESQTWATRLTQRIADLQLERLNLVGPLQRGMDTVFCWGDADCTYEEATAGYWTFTDNEPGKGSQGKWQDTAETKTSCSGTYYQSVQHWDQANAARDAYINSINEDMDGHFGDANKTIKGFIDAIAAWDESMKPRKPQSAPVVDGDLSKWGGDTPQQGTGWVSGDQVRYAVTFTNSAGIGPQGPWGPWTSITTKSWPLVVDLPTDPLELAKARQLHRQFAAPDGTLGDDVTVATIPDAESVTYQDVSN